MTGSRQCDGPPCALSHSFNCFTGNFFKSSGVYLSKAETAATPHNKKPQKERKKKSTLYNRISAFQLPCAKEYPHAAVLLTEITTRLCLGMSALQRAFFYVGAMTIVQLCYKKCTYCPAASSFLRMEPRDAVCMCA